MTPSNPKKPDSTNSSSVGLGILFRGMARYPLITFGFVLLAGMAGAAIWFFLPLPKMTGYATLQIKEHIDYILNPLQIGDAKVAFNVYRQSQGALIKSRRVLTDAVSRPELKGLNQQRWKPDPATWLENQLKVDFKLGPEFMTLRIEGNDGEELEKIISATLTSYLETVQENDKEKKRVHLARLENARKVIEEQLEGTRAQIQLLADTLATTDANAAAVREKYLQEAIGEAMQDTKKVEKDLLELGSELKIRESFIEQANNRSIPEEKILERIKAKPEYQQRVEKRNQFQKAIDEDKRTLKKGASLPQIEVAEKELTQIDAEIERFAVSIRPQVIEQLKTERQIEETNRKVELDRMIAIKKETEIDFKKREEELQKRAKDQKTSQIKLEKLTSDLTYNTKIADQLFSQIQSLKPEIENSSSRVETWEKATVVPGIEGNRRMKYSAMAFGAILFCGIGLVSWLEYRNRRILHVNEVTSELGLRFVGSVPALPRQALRSRTPVLDDELLDWQHHLTETIDNTRTMLLHGLDTASPVRTIMITSALSGEGKTSLSGHLAVSLARRGYKTLLIDADMRRPSLHKVFGLDLGPGLSDLLRFKTDVKSVLRETQIPGLTVLSAGDWHGGLPSVLAGDRFADLKTEFEQEFDYIIVDSPPLLPVADSLMIARHVDGVLLSLLRDVSQLQAVSEAKERLMNVGTQVLGVVMNGMKHDLFQYSPYYYRQRSKISIPADKV